MTLLLKVPGILVDQYTVDMTPLAARMLNISYPRLTCFGRLLASGLLSNKVIAANRKWLQRRKKNSTQDPQSFVIINHALQAVEQVKLGKKPWCATCYEVRPNLLTCSRCKKTHYCSPSHQKSHWKLHKKDCAGSAK